MNPGMTGTGVHTFDRACFKVLIAALIFSCSVTRMPFILGTGPKHASFLYLDIPVLLAILLLIGLNRLLNPGRPTPKAWDSAFLPLALLTAWWSLSGLMMARSTDFLIASLVQQAAGVAVALLLPGVLAAYGLTAFTLDALLWFSIPVALGSFLQSALDPAKLFENPNSTLGPNHAQIGLYMLAVFTVALYRNFQGVRSWLPRVAAFLAFVVIVISGSRASQLGMMAVLLVLLLHRLSFANFLRMSVLAAVLAGSLWYVVEQRKASQHQDTTFQMGDGVQIDMSSGRRILMWIVTWRAINRSTERFVTGAGFTTYRWEYGKSIKLPFYTNAAHNVFLHVWFETGLLGLILYLWSLYAPFRRAVALRKAAPGISLLAGLMVGTFLSGFTQETLYPNEAFANINVHFFLACMALLLSARLRSGEPFPHREAAPEAAPAAGTRMLAGPRIGLAGA